MEDVGAALRGMNNIDVLSDSEDESVETFQAVSASFVEENRGNSRESRQPNRPQSNRRQIRNSVPKYRSAIKDTPFYMSHPPQHNLGPLD